MYLFYLFFKTVRETVREERDGDCDLCDGIRGLCEWDDLEGVRDVDRDEDRDGDCDLGDGDCEGRDTYRDGLHGVCDDDLDE